MNQITPKKEVPLSATTSQAPKKSWGSSTQMNYGSAFKSISSSLSQKKKETNNPIPSTTLHLAKTPPLTTKSPSKPKHIPLFIDPSILALTSTQPAENDQSQTTVKPKSSITHSQSSTPLNSFLESRINLNQNPSNSPSNQKVEKKSSPFSPTLHSTSLSFLPIKSNNSSEKSSQNISDSSQNISEDPDSNTDSSSQSNSRENTIGLFLPSNNEKDDIVINLKNLVHQIQNRPDQNSLPKKDVQYVPPLFRGKPHSKVPDFMEKVAPANQFEEELLCKPKKHRRDSLTSSSKTTTKPKKKEKKTKDQKTKRSKKETKTNKEKPKNEEDKIYHQEEDICDQEDDIYSQESNLNSQSDTVHSQNESTHSQNDHSLDFALFSPISHPINESFLYGIPLPPKLPNNEKNNNFSTQSNAGPSTENKGDENHNINNNSQFLVDLTGGTMKISEDAIEKMPEINENTLANIFQEYTTLYQIPDNHQIPQFLYNDAETDRFNPYILEQRIRKQSNLEQSNMEQNDIEQNNVEQNNVEQNNAEQNNIEQNNVEQNNIEQNNIEQNNVEQNNIEQNNIEQNNGQGRRKYHFKHNHKPHPDKIVPLEPEPIEYK